MVFGTFRRMYCYQKFPKLKDEIFWKSANILTKNFTRRQHISQKNSLVNIQICILLITVLQNWKSVQLKCGVLGCCLPLLVHQYHASTSEIEIISIGIHDLAASQHQFLDDTKCTLNIVWVQGSNIQFRIWNTRCSHTYCMLNLDCPITHIALRNKKNV